MDVKKVVRALMDKGWGQEALAKEFDVSQPTISRWLKGTDPRGRSWIALRDLARQEGLVGEDEPDHEPTAPDTSSAVAIMGLIGAGGHVEPDYEQVPDDGLYAVELPFPVPEEMIGFEVIGLSMRPRFKEGDVVLVYREPRRPIESLIGDEAAVRTIDGRRYIKTIMPGARKNTYNLESFNAETIQGARLEWYSDIYLILPRAQIRHVAQKQRAAALRRARNIASETVGMERLPFAEKR